MAQKVIEYKPIEADLTTPLEPKKMTSLSNKERTLFNLAPMMSFEEDFGVINLEKTEEIQLEDIPPLEGSINIGNTAGTKYPYVFMSYDEVLMECALRVPVAARNSVCRTQGFDDDSRLFFVGFDNLEDAEFFYWLFAYEDTLTEEVTFNGHRVVCGEELLDTYKNVI